MEIIQQLTQALGVTNEQASGGAGLLFKLAKEKLGGQFGEVEAAVPGVSDLIGKAPSGGGGAMGALGGLLSAVGVGGSQLGNLASLAGGFSKLGLDAGMVGKFVPIILQFVQSKGGEKVKSLLASALK